MKEMTKAEQLVEIAKWVKNQNPEFTKHFKTMRSIIKFYLQLPDDYDRQKSVVAFINRGMKSSSYMEKQKAERLALIINTIFGFRYIKGAPYKWHLFFGFRSWTERSGKEHLEVYCTATDRCSTYNEFHLQDMGTCSITIKSRGDAKRAADRLLAEEIERRSNDYETEYGLRLLELMKQVMPTEEELTVGYEVRI